MGKIAKSATFFLVLLLLARGTAWARDAENHAGLASIRVSGGGVLHKGQVVNLTWDALPKDTEEFELLLLCEAPVPITLRLTECEEPELRFFSWRVPGLPSLRARIVLRRGEKGDESLWAQSQPFQILADCGLAEAVAGGNAYASNGPRVSLRDGELWLREDSSRKGLDESATGLASEELSGRNEAALQPGVVSCLAIPAGAAQHGAERARAPIRRSFAQVRYRKPSALQLRI